ncbi:universal stress protein [Streptomyces violascens]|uniref:universal stress protein n=1 Tax=Streptomyces violascens TaxID=67381 RepID=UPI0036A2FD14
MLQPIVVGVDGSRESVAAVDWAARDALRRARPLRIVHAQEVVPQQDEPTVLPELRVPQYWARRVLCGALDRVSERYSQVYVSAEQIARPPIPALVAAAEEAELLVLGSQGFGGPGGRLAGSVAMAVVGQAGRPVVLVRAGYTAGDERLPAAGGRPAECAPYRDVAVAVDLSHACASLLEFAFQEAERRHAILRVIHAWHPPTLRTFPAQAQQDAEWVLASSLEPWRDKYPEVTVRARAVEGRPTHHVLELADAAGLLVIGRETHRPPIGGHLGRVAHAAIHHVQCPVAVVAHG